MKRWRRGHEKLKMREELRSAKKEGIERLHYSFSGLALVESYALRPFSILREEPMIRRSEHINEPWLFTIRAHCDNDYLFLCQLGQHPRRFLIAYVRG